MRKLLVLALAIASGILPAVTEAQGSTSGSGIITGRVTDVKTNQPIVGAQVLIEGSVREVATDDNGQYRLDRAPEGKRILTVRYMGYSKGTREVTIGSGATVVVDVTLEPTASMLNQVVVTGTQIPTEIRAIPNAVTIITGKELEERNITSIDQLFRGYVPGLFAVNYGALSTLDSTVVFSRGANTFPSLFGSASSTGIKTYLDGIELTNYTYLNQIDPRTVDRVEIVTGPQASVIYGNNAINGVMQVFTKRGSTQRRQMSVTLLTGTVENEFSSSLAPNHDASGQISGTEGRLSYYAGGSFLYMGHWSPARQNQRYNGSAAARMQFGSLTGDISSRMGEARNVLRGSSFQQFNAEYQDGTFLPPGNLGVLARTTTTRSAKTFGATVSYKPWAWWSHDLIVGSDAADTELLQNERDYSGTILDGTTGVVTLAGNDTTFTITRDRSTRNSSRYITTASFPVAMLQGVVTAGVDQWSQTSTALATTSSTVITGSLTGVRLSRFTNRNSGLFIQGQLGWQDALFVTLGLRAESSRNLGEDASPDIAARYGVAYTRDLGMFTAKVRGGYGRATRTPGFRQASDTFATKSSHLTRFGKYLGQIGNPDLGPEAQKGGEAGFDLYFSNRGSLSVTYYNQTVDGLVARTLAGTTRSIVSNTAAACIPGTILGSDTISTESMLAADGFCYINQYQNVNMGAIRNNGWELSGTTKIGPLATRGVWSFTKSRMIGLTPVYAAQYNPATSIGFSVAQPGYGFAFLPEHTWSLGFNYANFASLPATVALNINGVGSFSRSQPMELGAFERLIEERTRILAPAFFRPVALKGYATADLSASYKVTQKIEGLLQVDNLTNHFQNDVLDGQPVIGRQTKIGARIRM